MIRFVSADSLWLVRKREWHFSGIGMLRVRGGIYGTQAAVTVSCKTCEVTILCVICEHWECTNLLDHNHKDRSFLKLDFALLAKLKRITTKPNYDPVHKAIWVHVEK